MRKIACAINNDLVPKTLTKIHEYYKFCSVAEFAALHIKTGSNR